MSRAKLGTQSAVIWLDLYKHGASTPSDIIERTGVSDSTARRICKELLASHVLVQSRPGVYDLGFVKPELPLWARGLAHDERPLHKRLYIACEKKLRKLDPVEAGILENYPPFALARRVYARRRGK